MKKIVYSRPKGFTERDIVLVMILYLKEYYMPYSKNTITSEEELDIEVEHYNFLREYNLHL